MFVSHDLATVEGVCDRAVWLRDGVVAGDGPVRDVLNSYREALEQVAELGARIGADPAAGGDGAEPRRRAAPARRSPATSTCASTAST